MEVRLSKLFKIFEILNIHMYRVHMWTNRSSSKIASMTKYVA